MARPKRHLTRKKDFNALEIGVKINYVAEKEHLDTVPPTSIAKEINIAE